MREVVRTSGFADLDKALAELPKATARNVLKRTLRKAGEPIAEKARRLAPVDTGQLRDSIAVSPKIRNKVGSAEFAAVMRAGGTRSEARQALIAARRASGPGSFEVMYVGPTALPHAHMMEFGTSTLSAQPFMRPAWDGEKMNALGIMKTELGSQIIAAAKRISRSKRQTYDVKYRASLAAMMAAEAGY